MKKIYQNHKYFIIGLVVYMCGMFFVELSSELYYRYLMRNGLRGVYSKTSIFSFSSPNIIYGLIIVYCIYGTLFFLSLLSYYKYWQNNQNIYKKILVFIIYGFIILLLVILYSILALMFTNIPR